MAQDKATQTTPPGSPSPHTTAPVTSTCSTQPQNTTAIHQACTCNYPQSTGLIMTTPRPAALHPSTSVALHWSGHEATTTVDQSTAPAASQPLPQFMRSSWTAQEVTQLVQLRSQGLSWSGVSAYFGKTPNACRKRHERHTKGTLRRGPVIQD